MDGIDRSGGKLMPRPTIEYLNARRAAKAAAGEATRNHMPIKLNARDREILPLIDEMPKSGKVSTQIAAVLEGCSVKSIIRRYRVVKAGRRNLVRLGDLRKGDARQST
jgi:hypothetical protein